MGNIVVKVAPERDAYLAISTYTDQVIGFGTREEMVEILFDFDDRKRERIREDSHDHPENRVARADLRGTSSMLGDWGWDSDELMYCTHDGIHGQQLLKREHLGEVYDRYRAACEAAEPEDSDRFIHPDLQDLLEDIDYDEDDD